MNWPRSCGSCWAGDEVGYIIDRPSRSLAPVDYQSLFQAAPAAHLVLATDDPQFTIIDANAAYLQATGTEHAAIIGRSLLEVFAAKPENPDDRGVSSLRASLKR